MGQCLSADDYERTEYKYVPYDWLGDRDKGKEKSKHPEKQLSIVDKNTNQPSVDDKNKNKPSLDYNNHPTVDIKVCAINGVNNYDTVAYKADIYNTKDINHFTLTLIMGQCTSARTPGGKPVNDIEDAPYAPAPTKRTRRNSEPHGKYKSREPSDDYRPRYKTYDWDIYVETDKDAKRDRARSFSNLRWDAFGTPEKEQPRRKMDKSKSDVAKVKPGNVEGENVKTYSPKSDKRGDTETGDKNRRTPDEVPYVRSTNGETYPRGKEFDKNGRTIEESPYVISTNGEKDPRGKDLDKSGRTPDESPYVKHTNGETYPLGKDLDSESSENDSDYDDDRLSVTEVKPYIVTDNKRGNGIKPVDEPIHKQTNGSGLETKPVRDQPKENKPEKAPVYRDTTGRRGVDNEPIREQAGKGRPVSVPVFRDTGVPGQNESPRKQTTRNKPDEEPIVIHTNGNGLESEPVNKPTNKQQRPYSEINVSPKDNRPDKYRVRPVSEQINGNVGYKPVIKPTNGNTAREPVNKPTNGTKIPVETTPTRRPFTERLEDDYPRQRIAEKQLTRNLDDDETPRKLVAALNNKDYNDYNTDEMLRKKDAPPDYSDVVPQPVVVVPTAKLSPRTSDTRPVYYTRGPVNGKQSDPDPAKSDTRNSIHGDPKYTDVFRGSPSKKSPQLAGKDKGDDEGIKDRKAAPMYKPKLSNGQVTPNNKPPGQKEKGSGKPVVTTAIISPIPDFLSTRPEKDAVKETVLIPNKFPQLFVGKRHAWRGLLLFGPAGSGKASLATAVAKEIGHSYCTLRTFMSLNSVNGNAIEAMFKKARDSTPHVVIIDHLDGLSAAELRELHNQMAASTDEQFEGLLVVGISDSPWLLDKSVVELFEKRIYITLPSAASRAELFRENLQQSQHAMSEEDFIELGAWSEGYSCADIITVVNETLMRSLRKIQEATYFKKISAKDPETNRPTDLYTPCSPGENGAIEMDWSRVPEKKLQEPVVRLCDVLVALRTQKASLSPDDIDKHKQFAKRFTQNI